MRVWFSELVDAAAERDADPVFAEVSDQALVEGLSEQASVIAVETCRWLQMLAEMVRRRIWARDGARTPAAWLSWKVSMADSTAREHVRVALALADYPRVTARFAAGTLSYSKVRAIVGCGRPELEEVLLEFADHATGQQMQQIRSRFVASDQPDRLARGWGLWSCERRQVNERVVELRVRLPVDEADAAWNDLDRRGHQLWQAHRRSRTDAAAADDAGDAAAAAAADMVVPLTACRAQAAVEAFTGLADGLPADTSGQDRHLVVLHTTTAALQAPPVGQDRLIGVDEAAGHRTAAMSSRTLRRLACDGQVRRVVHDDDGEVVDVSEQRRRPTAKQRMQLLLRDGGCRFPSCSSRTGLHAHHIVHWEDGGATELVNLVLLCGFHHRFVHEHGWTVIHDGRGRFRFRPPDVGMVPTVAALPGADPGPLPSADWIDQFDPDDWYAWRRGPLQAELYGDTPDYDDCLLVLHQALERLRTPEHIAVAA